MPQCVTMRRAMPRGSLQIAFGAGAEFVELDFFGGAATQAASSDCASKSR